ncbi:MAG TPA: ATP-binding protein, partial [Polyangiaceae bacterium]|nr:ATP-binding protein [Polyangiaceae bacterium]
VGSVLDQTTAVGTELQLRRALSLLEEAQALAQVGSWRFDPETGEVEWSREFRRIAGLSPDETPSVEAFLARVVAEDLPRFLELYQTCLVAPQAGSVEGRLLRTNGEMRHVRIIGELVEGAYSRRELRGTLLDITDQVRLRNELAHSQKMETVGRLAGGIAHDFNNLLTVVMGNLEVLQFNIGEHEELTECFRALESASNLTRRLLAFGRKAQLSLKVIAPNELVTSTLLLLQRLVGDQILLSTKLADDLPLISVDAVEMERALVNLVINARDFTPLGGEVLIETSQSEEQGEVWVHFSVVDQGPGIDEADVSQVFEPFFTTRGHAGGSGLGLATVLGTAEQHGGSARVTTPESGGTVFTISLPSAPVDAARSRKLRDSMPPVGDDQWSVLVIDDEPKVADVTRLMLQAMGHRARVATSHDDALSVWYEQGTEFDLVLCD